MTIYKWQAPNSRELRYIYTMGMGYAIGYGDQ